MLTNQVLSLSHWLLQAWQNQCENLRAKKAKLRKAASFLLKQQYVKAWNAW